MPDRYTVVLDPGHGGMEAVGGSTPNRGIATNGLFEKDVALDLAERVRERLRDDFTIVLTRERDVNLALADRAAAARRVAADLFVSIHFSGRPDRAASATDVITARHRTPQTDQLARVVRTRTGQVTGLPGEILEANLGQLAPERHDPKTAAVLVEVSSMDDPAQAERLLDQSFRDRLADALAASVRESASSGSGPDQMSTRAIALSEIDQLEYNPTSLYEANRIWTDWGARIPEWYAGVPEHVLRFFPHAAICQLVVKLQPVGGNPAVGHGTGFYIANEVLLTCGHNFYRKDAFPTPAGPVDHVGVEVEVQPAYHPTTSILPAKSFPINYRNIVHPRWRDHQDDNYDLAVLPVPGLPTSAGTFSLSNVTLTDPTVPIVIAGYGKLGNPNTYDSQGQRMDGARITKNDLERINYPIIASEGSSGSPVFHKEMVIAVHTAREGQTESSGVLLTPTKNDWIVNQAGGGISIGLGSGPPPP